MPFDSPPQWTVLEVAPWVVVVHDTSSDPLTSTSVEISGGRAVVAFGHVRGRQLCDTAAEIVSRWRTGGATETRRAGGSYAAALIDVDQQSIELVNDRVGTRALRYVEIDGFFIASSHDVGVMATGLIDPRPDPVSFASLAVYGWSVGAGSLIETVSAVPPQATVRWAGISVELIPDWIDTLDDAERNGDGVVAAVDAIEGYIASECASSTSVSADLTAGVDSRAICATLASISSLPVRFQTSGPEQSVDVSVARHLAREANVAHIWNPADSSDVNHLAASVALLAFSVNGDCSAKYAYPTGPQESGHRHFTGVCGEEVRGYPFPRIVPSQVRDLSASELAAMWDERIRGHQGESLMTAVHSDVMTLVIDRLRDKFEQVRPLYEHGQRALSVVVRNEYGRVKMGYVQRYPRLVLLRFPFKEAAMYEAWGGVSQLMLHRGAIHYELIQRHQPGWLRSLVNGRSLVPKPTESSLGRRTRQVRQATLRQLQAHRSGVAETSEGDDSYFVESRLLVGCLESDVSGQFTDESAEQLALGTAPRALTMSLLTANEFWRQVIAVASD